MSRDPLETQSQDSNTWVGVRSDGFDQRSRTEVASEFVIQQNDPSHHLHFGLDEYGNEIFRNER
jgi:hypothetical protein